MINKVIIDELIVESKKILNINNKGKDVKKILKGLINKRIIKKDYIFWPNALIIYSLIMDNKEKDVIIKQFELFKKSKYRINNYDDALMIYLFLKNKEFFDICDMKKIQEKMIEKLFLFKNDVIPYRLNNKNEVFIDLLGMVPPFLCLYGINNKDDNIINWAVMQYIEFLKYGFNQDTDMPFHVYNKETKQKDGIVGWSRSLGWILFGLAESIRCLYEKNNDKYKELFNIYTLILNSVIKYMKEDGGFSWQIITKDGHLDTSGTSMIALSILILKEQKIIGQEYDVFIEKNIMCLEKNVKNGKVFNCSAECLGIGLYPQKYSSYAWSVGPTLGCFMLYNKLFNYDFEKGNN